MNEFEVLPKTRYNPISFLVRLHTKHESYWLKRGEKRALNLYRESIKRISGYRDFISSRTQRVQSIRNIDDFTHIPLTSKDTYLRKYPLHKLVWDDEFSQKSWTIAATSGSTGEPFYFPRQEIQDNQYALIAELYLRTNFQIHKRSTLYIIGWGMGVWIGGVFSYAALKLVSQRGAYSLSIITPGPSKDEIIKAIQSLGHKFNQVIIGGYPPMIKDLIDEGVRIGLDWSSYHPKFIFSAEGFSEGFRDYVARKTGLQDIYKDTLNHYGTVDLGTMAHETPLAILIRRIARNNSSLNSALFGHPTRQPTLAQYVPELFYFEGVDGKVVCTATSGIPLIRYDLIDTGGVLTLTKIHAIFREHGVDLDGEMKRARISSTVWNIPFVYVFERSDFVIKFYGANIYPQEIRRALEHTSVEAYVTGKCVMHVKYTQNMNQQLHIHIELRWQFTDTAKLTNLLKEVIVKELLQTNSEYTNNYRSMSHILLEPHIHCHPYRSGEFFSANGKHSWIKKGHAQ